MTRQVSLQVNDETILLDYFAQTFIDHTTAGMIEALEDTEPIKELTLVIEGAAAITLNGRSIRVNAFVSKIINSTTTGMISVLKGVKDIKKVQIHITR
jgi:hypothetical protein